jgi:hypothetical protein
LLLIAGIDMEVPAVAVGDRVQTRKPHPCGSDQWRVTRIGADIGLQCLRCGRRVLLARGDFNKRLKRILLATENTE